MTTELSHQPSRSVDGVELPVAGTYEIDASHTHVGFVVRHLMLSKTRGRFPDVSGTVVIGDHALDSSVEVSIATGSVDTGDDKRDGHLRSGDFFAADQHPAITYRSRRVSELAPGRWDVGGALTVR